MENNFFCFHSAPIPAQVAGLHGDGHDHCNSHCQRHSNLQRLGALGRALGGVAGDEAVFDAGAQEGVAAAVSPVMKA